MNVIFKDASCMNIVDFHTKLESNSSTFMNVSGLRIHGNKPRVTHTSLWCGV